MAIRGSLREASLPDVLQLLAMGKKTGCLSVTHRHAFGNIFFDKGRICFASIVNRRDRLGDILVKSGMLLRDDLERAIAIQSSQPDRRIGEILVSESMIAREELHQHIRQQIEEAVFSLFTWVQGTFSFEPDIAPDEQDFQVSINPESLLLEGARRIDEWELIQKKISSFDLVFALDRAHLAQANVALTLDHDSILPLLDGRRDVAAITEESGLPEFTVAKTLFELATAGFLHRVGRTPTPESVSVESRIAEHRNLGVAFYKSGMPDEAIREFRRVLELRPEDEVSAFHLALAAIRQGRMDEAIRGLRELATRIPTRAPVHVNLAYALERTGRLDEARAALARAEALLPADDTVALLRAVLALRRGDVEGAEVSLEASAGNGPRGRSAAWYHYAGIAAAYAGDLDRAIDILTRGVAAHPGAPTLANNLAVVLERRGRYAEAAEVVERGLHEGPSIAQLHKNAGDLRYRTGQFEEALEAYARAVRLAPDLGGDVWLKLGNIRFRRGETEDATRCWERSLALAPDNPLAKSNLEMARRGA
jgi:tetratricopeptide (TPR) repeat protein